MQTSNPIPGTISYPDCPHDVWAFLVNPTRNRLKLGSLFLGKVFANFRYSPLLRDYQKATQTVVPAPRTKHQLSFLFCGVWRWATRDPFFCIGCSTVLLRKIQADKACPQKQRTRALKKQKLGSASRTCGWHRFRPNNKTY